MKKGRMVKFVNIIRASKHKHKMKRVRSKSRSYEMNLGQNNSKSALNEDPLSSSILPPSSPSHSPHANFRHTSDKTLGGSSIKSLERRDCISSTHKTSTFSKLRLQDLISKSKRRTMRKQIRHKQHGIKDTVDMVDYISNLPDCILHQILSCIPTKEVVKTSVLSPRWKNLWDSVPNLDVDATEIDEWNPPKLSSFMNFLERVLHSRGKSDIKKFCLTCSGKNEESQLHSWISDAINHNLQELELQAYEGVPFTDTMSIAQELYLAICSALYPFTIPWSILDSTSLVSLKITANDFGELPSSFSLPCLKTLHLEHIVMVTDDQVEKLQKSCPILEELVLIDIWMNLKNIDISNSTLRSLTIRDMHMFVANDDPSSVCKIKIDAENLASFKYSGYLSNEILLDNVSSLVKVFLDFTPRIHPELESIVADRVVKLLERIRVAQRETSVRKRLENTETRPIICFVKYE